MDEVVDFAEMHKLRPAIYKGRLALAGLLCRESMSFRNELKEHTYCAIFYAGVVLYYSACKTNEVVNKNTLLESLKRISLLESQKRLQLKDVELDSSSDRTMYDVFLEFEGLRDKNIAHFDSNGVWDRSIEWMRSKAGSVTPLAFIPVPHSKMSEFLLLVLETLKILTSENDEAKFGRPLV